MASAVNEPVLIAGAGIGGLAAALALARRGIACHVLERRAAFSEHGAGIQIGPNGTRILRALGVSEVLQPYVGVPDWLIAHDAISGAELSRLPLNARMEPRFGAPYWVAHREDLHAALLEGVRKQANITISMGVGIKSATSDGSHAHAILTDGTASAAPLLVAADGLYSTLRGDALRPIAIGKAAYRAVVPVAAVDPELVNGGTRIWLTRSAHIVHYAVRGGRELAIVLIVDEKIEGGGWSNDADVEPALSRLKLAAPLRALLRTPKHWRKWSLSTLPQLPRMATGRVALLGDAAHPTLPFLAQGGVLALEDAVVLAEAVATKPGDVANALQIYRTAREPRVRRVVGASRRNGQIYHLGGTAGAARNVVMRLTPGSRLVARYDWIYGWKP